MSCTIASCIQVIANPKLIYVWAINALVQSQMTAPYLYVAACH